MELKEILNNPATAGFSRIKYLQRYCSDDQIMEFLNQLFLAAVESKYTGDWEKLIKLLDKWEDEGINLQFQGMKFPETDSVPWAILTKPPSQCKVAIVTTGGIFLEGQMPYTERGDSTYRQIPRDFVKSDIRIWHPGYDHGPAEQDINCIFPVDRFKELEEEDVIGELAETNYSFMGLIDNPVALMAETAPEAARRLKDAGVDVVFLAST